MAKLDENYLWLDAFMMNMPGVEKDYKEEWDATRYMLRGKMFAMLGGDREARPILTVKLEPSHGELLRSEHDAIVPGYYMNKVHWNSLYLEAELPQQIILDLARESYGLILSSLPKKAQREIMEGA